jgi:hypothetical protein
MWTASAAAEFRNCDPCSKGRCASCSAASICCPSFIQSTEPTRASIQHFHAERVRLPRQVIDILEGFRDHEASRAARYGFFLATAFAGLLFAGCLFNWIANPTRDILNRLDKTEYAAEG